jgi:hypothetical protein
MSGAYTPVTGAADPAGIAEGPAAAVAAPEDAVAAGDAEGEAAGVPPPQAATAKAVAAAPAPASVRRIEMSALRALVRNPADGRSVIEPPVAVGAGDDVLVELHVDATP